MRELRPLIGLLGLAVVIIAIAIGVARASGWRFGWWERLFSPGRRRRRARASGDEPPEAGARASGERRDPGTIQIPLGLDDIPLIDARTAARPTAIDTLEAEFELGDIGSVATEPQTDVLAGSARARPHAESRPAPPPESPASDAPSRDAPPRDAAPPEVTPQEEEAPRAGFGNSQAPSPADERLEEEPAALAQESTDSELLIVLTILTPGERVFTGGEVHRTLSAYGLEPDETGIYNHYGNRRAPNRRPLFSVANVLEPGAFDLDRMDEMATPGLCLFMRRPGPLSATVAFDLMLDISNRVARTLGGVLCDDRRCRLTVQGVQAMRERIAHFAIRYEPSSRAPRTSRSGGGNT